MLRENNWEITDSEDGFEFASGFGPTLAIASPVEDPDECQPSEVITITTKLPTGISEFTEEIVGVMKKLATLSAIVRLEDGPYLAASRVSVYPGFEGALEFERPLIYAMAVLQGEAVARTARYVFEEERDGFELLPGASDKTPCSRKDFGEVSKLLLKISFINSGPREVTAEFAWQDGAVSAQVGHQTSLMTIEHSTHPFWGNGLFFKLELPLEQDPEAISGCASDSTRWSLLMPTPRPSSAPGVPLSLLGRFSQACSEYVLRTGHCRADRSVALCAERLGARIVR
ncbi:MAG: hypothetical protein ABI718_08060 [Acidobacteriota bacterium]